jgi:hypothetical protein
MKSSHLDAPFFEVLTVRYDKREAKLSIMNILTGGKST